MVRRCCRPLCGPLCAPLCSGMWWAQAVCARLLLRVSGRQPDSFLAQQVAAAAIGAPVFWDRVAALPGLRLAARRGRRFVGVGRKRRTSRGEEGELELELLSDVDTPEDREERGLSPGGGGGGVACRMGDEGECEYDVDVDVDVGTDSSRALGGGTDGVGDVRFASVGLGVAAGAGGGGGVGVAATAPARAAAVGSPASATSSSVGMGVGVGVGVGGDDGGHGPASTASASVDGDPSVGASHRRHNVPQDVPEGSPRRALSPRNAPACHTFDASLSPIKGAQRPGCTCDEDLDVCLPLWLRYSWWYVVACADQLAIVAWVLGGLASFLRFLFFVLFFCVDSRGCVLRVLVDTYM